MGNHNTLHGTCEHPMDCDNPSVGYVVFRDTTSTIKEETCSEHYSQTIEEVRDVGFLELVRHRRIYNEQS